MAKIDPTLWHKLMDSLRQRHPTLCRQWFEELEPLSLESGTLLVRTSNSVQQRYLQGKCVPQFTEAAQTVTGKLVAVTFINAGDIAPRTPGNGSGHHAPRPEETLHDERESLLARAPEQLPAQPRHGDTSPHAGDTSNQPNREDEGDLVPDYAFSTFVVGPENQLAYAAAIAVSRQLGTAYNPLFIHGGVGLGKTHLLQAICQSVIQRDPGLRICYLSCDRFVNDFLDCVQKGEMAGFRHRYRHVDLLVIDDIQFLANRERTQEEFFHTFNELYQAKKQIVLSSDCPPAEIPKLEERLVSRFQWGLVADVAKPTFETRVAIVRAKARLRGQELPEDVINFIAERFESNARELEGAINTLQAHAQTKERPITIELAREVIGGNHFDTRSAQVTLQTIIEAVTRHYDVKLSDLQSKRRQKSIAEPRQVCMWLARKRTRFSLQEIGGYFGGRDHTTVMHSIRTVDDRIGLDPSFAHAVNRMEEFISRAQQAQPAA